MYAERIGEIQIAGLAQRRRIEEFKITFGKVNTCVLQHGKQRESAAQNIIHLPGGFKESFVEAPLLSSQAYGFVAERGHVLDHLTRRGSPFKWIVEKISMSGEQELVFRPKNRRQKKSEKAKTQWTARRLLLVNDSPIL